MQPYTADANTLFLFHLDEPGGSVTTNAGLLGGNAYTVNQDPGSTNPPEVTGVLGSASYTNFGNAALLTPGDLIGFDYNNNGRYDGDAGSSELSADSFPMSVLNMGNGGQTPWTLEAMICPSTVANGNQEIICTDCSATSPANRGFQFRINSSSCLELNLIAISGADITTPIPTTATDPVNGFVANNWYHVAAAYDGTNIVLYWTKVSPTTTADNPISTNAVAVGPSFGAVQGSLGIGNRTRSPAIEYFQGLIDEVRISNVARAANQMLFSSRTASISASATLISPGNSVYAGTVITLSATVSGTLPINYLWRSDGGTGGVIWTNLPNSSSNTYSINTAAMAAGTYQYCLVVSNSAGMVTNTPATLTLLAPSGPVVVTNTMITPATVFAGNPVTLSAAFTGNQPISYQWFFTTNGGGTTIIAGATNSTYVIASTQTNDNGSYFLMASNNPPGLGGQTSSSSPAALTVLADSSPISGMICELLGHPEETVITAAAPKFGWIYQASFRNDYQTAYRIIVASSQALAAADTGDMWDSGFISNSNSLNVVYAGSALQPGSSYYWRVQTVNSLGQTNAFSGIQQFNTASQLFDNLTTGGVIYQQPAAGSANCYPLRYVTVVPVLVTTNSLGHWFVDFGNDAFGYATVNLNGNFTGSVNFGLGELASDNIVNTSPGATIRYWSGSFALGNGNSNYVCRSTTAVGTISPPTATYGIVSPFRYLELSGVPAGVVLTTNNFTQQRLQTEFDDNAATFNSSSTALNAVWNLCHYSMKALSFDGIYVDGDRERTPYEADTYIHMMSSYGVNNDFTMPRCTFEYLTNHLTWPTEWPLHMVFIAWADYQQTGDPYLMTKYYNFLTNKCLLSSRASPTVGLVQSYPETGNTASGDIIDWYRDSGDGMGNIDGYVPEATNAVINAFYYRVMTLMTQMAQLTGHAVDASNFAARASLVYSNFNRVFWNAGTQSYLDGEGTTHSSADANFFPLVFGLVPAGNQAAVVNYIHSRIAATNCMPAGVYGAQYLLEGLFLAGDANTALGLITTNNTRSWMNMINIGSTITDEAWSTADKNNEDWNHAWGSAPGNLIPRYVLGLRPLDAGFGQVLIQPQLGQTLSFVQGTIPTIRGPVFICASNAPGQFQLLVNVPGNVTATVMLPATNTAAILDGDVVSGILSTDAMQNIWLTLTNIGSGQHAIWASTTNAPSLTTLYNNWAASWFGTNAANPAIAGPTANPDGNGVSNYDDFIAGLDPTNPNSLFTITAALSGSPPHAVVTLQGAAGRSYILQESSTLSPPAWNSIVTNGVLNSNLPIQMADPAPANTQAYYRVLVTLP
ncbi:MAG TPA: alpha-L-rhamnosidase C-terminal domain-containing protein [Verrucomicrobiae bacterium]|nr:alpha-L-rhamnosidase C-terminal domain-containing protein [Verrucomicrobiae bacterium]